MSQATAVPRVDAPARAGRKAKSRSLLRPVLMIGGIAVVAVGALLWWLNTGAIVSVDDAYVRAAKLAVTTDVSGIVAEVAVHEGQHVNKGDLLLQLDPRQFEIALEGAKANLAQTALTMEAMKRDYRRMQRDIDAKDAQVQSDQATFDRYAPLVKGGGITREMYDDARFKLAASKQALDSLREQARVQLAKLGGDADVDVTTTPHYLQARAQVDEAQRQLDHSRIFAPFEGTVTQVESVQPGMYLAAASPAFGLVSSDHVWIEANAKETDLTWVKPGDHVQVTVDTYPGRVWDGVVESISPASGSEFSVLPAQNASGNWVKVVQRVPVRIRVDRAPGDPDLRTGMSVIADIDTGHHRKLSDLF